MAKIIHSSSTDVVDNIVSTAKEKGTMHIQSEEQNFDGTYFTINGKQLKNFGTCGYLALETHPDLIEGSIDLTRRFGTQLSMSRAFIKPAYVQELEELMSQIFNGNKVICYSSTSNAHLSVIPNVVKPTDLIILDQQVHYSVQYACMNMKLYGTEIQMVRHSNYDKLDEMITELYNQYDKIWYMSDGLYSMHGDFPDTDKLKALMVKHPKLHLYFDDAHGMSWSGKNGAGYVYDRMGVSERIILISTMAKGFGCVGGTAIFADPEAYRKTDIYGGVLSYTHPLPPATVGAAIASAKIHLSDEIYKYQQELRGLMDHLNERISKKNLTMISSLDSPIYFIGGGAPKVTINLVKRIIGEGLYVNTSTFPVVPNDKSGLRFTLTRHNKKEDIDELVDAIAYHLPKAIEEEGDQIEKVYKKFGVPYLGETNAKAAESQDTGLTTEVYSTINDVDKATWDAAMQDYGNITHSGMQCMEELFSNNEKPEENWTFHYLLIKDSKGKTILSTFFTCAIMKDDMLAQEKVSQKIEKVRQKDPYYLCTKTFMLGSMFGEGTFIFLDDKHPQYMEAVKLMFAFAENTKKEQNAKALLFRDFNEGHPMNKILVDEGYAKLRMPNTNIISLPKWNSYDEFLSLIPSANNRANIRRYTFKFEDQFDITIKKQVTEEEARRYYQLFLNVKRNNYNFNFFEYPEKTVEVLSKYDDWEFIDIRLKDKSQKSDAIASFWCFKGEDHYCALLIGLDYDYLKTHHVYKQIIFQSVKRANELNKETIYIGFSSDYEKQKYGSVAIPTYAYIKVDDTFNMEVIESYSNI
jgi:7-keto-8-aminopelargonate synthetase-like enzyme